MQTDKQFSQHLETMGQLPSVESQQNAVASVFSAIRAKMTVDEANEMSQALPSWLRSQWSQIHPQDRTADPTDVLDLIKSCGEYSYRGSAERVLRAVFGGLIEATDEQSQDLIAQRLPADFLPYWNRAQTCSLSQTMGEFL